MDKNYIGWLFVISFIMTIFIAGFASAGPLDDLGKIINDFVSGIEPFAKALLGDVAGVAGFDSSEVLFAKVLFLIIIFSIVWVALDRVDFFSSHRWALWLISVAVSIIATRWLTEAALIQAIILPYSTLGVALSAGLPFVLYFLVVNVGFKNQAPIVRRIAWVFFAVIFLSLWISRYDTLKTANAIYLYPVTALIAFIMAVMDGTIRKFFRQMELEKLGVSSSQDAITELKKKIAELPDLVTKHNVLTPQEAKNREREYRRKIKYLTR